MDRGSLICSVNRALLDEVGPALRAVAAKEDNGTIYLRFFVDGEPSDDDLDSASTAAAEVISDLPNFALNDQVVRCDVPQRIPGDGSWTVIFARRERT